MSITTFVRSLKENRRAQVLILSGCVLVIVIVVGALYMVSKNSTSSVGNENVAVTNIAEQPKKTRRVIDGVNADTGSENILPLAVMIENAAFGGVRPQAGLQDANVVYEAMAEGGITRFMAVYANKEVTPLIGPVRSARSYYVDFAEEYRAVYVHAGGSPQALSRLVGNQFVVDMNAIAADSRYFKRDYTQSRVQEHTLFTTKDLLNFALRDKGLEEKSGDYTGLKFKEDGADKKNRPTDQKTIDISFSSSSYDVQYTYNRDENYYLRTNGGEAHVDRNTGEQIHVRNVIVQYVETSLIDATSGRLDMKTVGEGKAVVFYDGKAIEATWKKPSRGERTRYYNAEGEEISLIPGNIWVEILPDDRTVEYN